MRQRETSAIQTALGELNDAILEMQKISEDADRVGYTVDLNAYAEAQQQAQQALIDLMDAGDAMVDDTDAFVTRDGEEIALPDSPLTRGADGLPEFPTGGG